MFTPAQLPNAPEQRRGFTLVELLVVIVVLGIIAGMVSQALTGANRSAQQTRAQGFVNRLNLTVLQLYEREANRRIGFPGTAWSAESANQTQMIWKRDWLRAILPDTIADIHAGSGGTAPQVFGVPFLSTTTRDVVSDDPRFAASARYRQRVEATYTALTGTPQTWPAAFAAWTREHESAECLYLIFASNTLNGQPLLAQLNDRDIAATDEDGMPEIVDSWGVPVLWMRSPAGFYLKNRWVVDESEVSEQPSIEEIQLIVNTLGPDPIDVLRTDPRANVQEMGGPTDKLDPNGINPSNVVDKATFFSRPLVVSAGQDGEFDLYAESLLDPIPAIGRRSTTSNDQIASLTAPVKRNRGGGLVPHPVGYGANVFFPDPFHSIRLSNPVTALVPMAQRPGAVTDIDGDEVDDSSDNVYPSLAL